MSNPEDVEVAGARAKTAAEKQAELTARRQTVQAKLFGPKPSGESVEPHRSDNPLGDAYSTPLPAEKYAWASEDDKEGPMERSVGPTGAGSERLKPSR